MRDNKFHYDRYDRQTSKGNEGGEVAPAKLEHEPVQAKFLEIVVKDNFDRAMKIFRQMVQKDGVLTHFKEKRAYEKPSDKKRRKQNEARQDALTREQKRKRREQR